MAQRPALQFKITLLDIEPPIWRRIQISDLCTFLGLACRYSGCDGLERLSST